MSKKRKIDPELFNKNPINFNKKEIRTIRNVLDSFDEDQETLFYGFIGAFIKDKTNDDGSLTKLRRNLICEIEAYLKIKKHDIPDFDFNKERSMTRVDMNSYFKKARDYCHEIYPFYGWHNAYTQISNRNKKKRRSL